MSLRDTNLSRGEQRAGDVDHQNPKQKKAKMLSAQEQLVVNSNTLVGVVQNQVAVSAQFSVVHMLRQELGDLWEEDATQEELQAV